MLGLPRAIGLGSHLLAMVILLIGSGSDQAVAQMTSAHPTITMAPVPTKSDAGLSIRGFSFNTANGTVQLAAITITTPRALRVVDMFDGISVQGYRTYALTEVLQALDPILAVSGAGGPSLSLPSPLGLVKDNGREASIVDKSSQFATGVLCIGSDGRPSIAYARSLNVSTCKQAMQSGPVMIAPRGKVTIHPNERNTRPYEHIMVAIDQRANLNVIASTSAHLYDLAQFLYGLHFAALLNLSSGLDHAAIVVRSHGIDYTYGNPDGSIPSALIMTR